MEDGSGKHAHHHFRLTTVGLLYLRIGENFRAFDFLGNSLTHDPRNSKTILAAGQPEAALCFDPPADPCHRIHHPRSLGHGRSTCQVSSCCGSDSELRTTVEQHRYVLLWKAGQQSSSSCFTSHFSIQRHVAAIACLKKALYLDPFEWIISYNLGLVHLHTGDAASREIKRSREPAEQYASAFHYFSSSINLKPDFPSSYMFLFLCALAGTLTS
eukprot:764539-Hanusia_phi.AAC.8